jgi:hypothetical protein
MNTCEHLQTLVANTCRLLLRTPADSCCEHLQTLVANTCRLLLRTPADSCCEHLQTLVVNTCRLLCDAQQVQNLGNHQMIELQLLLFILNEYLLTSRDFYTNLILIRAHTHIHMRYVYIHR